MHDATLKIVLSHSRKTKVTFSESIQKLLWVLAGWIRW